MSSSLFIVNPISGGNKNRRFQAELRDWVSQRMPSADWRVTGGPGDATRIAAEAARRGVDRIFSVGGDGTLHEILQGIAPLPQEQRPSLGALGGGTGGDYARGLKEQFGDPPDWNWLLEPGETWVDFGKAVMRDGAEQPIIRYFINIADAGLSGEVVRRVAQGNKKLGRWQYMISALQAGRSYRAPKVRLEGLNSPAKNFSKTFPLMMVVVAKGRYFGGGMAIAPQANLADGIFQVIVAEEISYFQLLRQFPNLYRKRPIQHPKVFYGTAAQLRLTALEGTLPLDLDGESFEASEVELDVCPKGLRILIPYGGRG